MLEKRLIEIYMSNLFDYTIFENLNEQEMNSVKKVLSSPREDCIDVIISFEDELLMENLIKNIPNDIPNDLDRKMILLFIWEKYLTIKILKGLSSLGIGQLTPEMNDYFDQMCIGDFESFKEKIYLACSYQVSRLINSQQEKRIILHFFMDDVSHLELQHRINDYFGSRAKLTCYGYTSKELLTYYDTNSNLVQSRQDYRQISGSNGKVR